MYRSYDLEAYVRFEIDSHLYRLTTKVSVSVLSLK